MPLADLSVERITDEAFALVNEKGADAFTLRAVAQRLNVTPMALYHHVKDKAELAGIVADRAITTSPMPELTDDWREDLYQMAMWVRNSANRFPQITHLRRSLRVWTPTMMGVTERWLEIWMKSGLSEDDCVQASIMSSLAINGLVNEELMLKNGRLPDDEVLEKVPAAKRVFKSKPDLQDMFQQTVRTIIDGLYNRLSAN
ncbi:MAG: hypothetical protein CMK06_05100 [Ponticaulis sp.]|nr:hypothetical protein [Ponticaulis sp.]|tara:strand:- start:1795 stop:2397 length:603 start_codon:yes stop_codon:yes gene_type:complete